MTRILTILEEFVKEMEKDNPYGLVMKGGTALSLLYLNHHRESEDLDFDADISLIKEHEKIEAYFIRILETLKQKNILKNFSKGKSGLASTNRYHLKLRLETYKVFDTKIDVDFVELPSNLKSKGKLLFYTPERLFVTKMVAFISRKELKDVYDIIHLIPQINTDIFSKNQNVMCLIDDVINTISNEDVTKLFKNAFRNVDLRFKYLKESEVNQFSVQVSKALRLLKNKLK